jgi:hypothetical protein
MLGGQVATTSKNLDDLAWEAITKWHEIIGFNRIGDGLDYNHLIRYFLWDKVGRSIRRQEGEQDFSFEAQLLKRPYRPDNYLRQAIFKSAIFRRAFSAAYPTLAQCHNLLPHNKTRFRPMLYVPIPSSKLARTLAGLIRDDRMTIIAPFGSSEGSLGMSKRLRPPAQSAVRHSLIDDLFEAVIAGLRKFQIYLDEYDCRILYGQLVDQQWHLQRVRAELGEFRPKALVMHADNHSPFLEYAMIARQMSIPVIMLQHGLDCERYYLDEAYASAIAVWSEDRKQRYQRRSDYQPMLLHVTGNPDYDGFQAPKSINVAGRYWLWLSRPHTSEKCLAPSRQPKEGVSIFESILTELLRAPRQQLVIKPHPCDYVWPYQDLISSHGLNDRVSIWRGPISSVLQEAKLVITEDSTSCLDAMLNGKPLVHAHFADSEPILPLADYGAALAARNGSQLAEMLGRVQELGSQDMHSMLSGQHRFIEDFAGNLDGAATKRAVDFIYEAIL